MPRSSGAQISETQPFEQPSEAQISEAQRGERLAPASRSARKSEWVYVDPDDPRMWPIATPEEGNGWAYVHQDLAIDTRARRLRVAFRLHSPTHQLLAWWREFGRLD
jgi:hypothetical protein